MNDKPHTGMKSLAENHRRGIAVTLTMMDEMLCDFERRARGEVSAGPLYRERDDLDAAQKTDLAREVAALRERICGMRDALSIEPRVWDSSVLVASKCSCFWENLVELESRRLRRYGEVPDMFGEAFDREIRAMIAGIGAISEIARRGKTAGSGPEDGGDSHAR